MQEGEGGLGALVGGDRGFGQSLDDLGVEVLQTDFAGAQLGCEDAEEAVPAADLEYAFALEEVRDCGHVFGEIDSALPKFEASFILSGDDVPGVGSQLVGVREVAELYAVVEMYSSYNSLTIDSLHHEKNFLTIKIKSCRTIA